MSRVFLLPLIATLSLSFAACQKQQTEAERNAEIERQVQQRLDAEHRTEEEQKLAQREAELDAREKALAEKENRPELSATPAETAIPREREAVANEAESESDKSSYATFYRKLDPYGDWIETSNYGFVFQPRQATQARDWRPYTNGHWVYTDAGWTWISDEQFGWATYHYGRWIRLQRVGWVWVPGEQWAPAWVSWRKGNDYVGWAPLPPEAQFDRQTGIRNWADNYYDIGPEQYAFVPANQFGAKVSARVVIPIERNITIINQTTNITNITYNNSVVVDRGPSYDDFRARSSQPIERFRLERTQDTNNERPVFRGAVVAVPTVDFRPAERATRPARVSQTIAQPVVEHGWAGIQDAQAAQKARRKMQAEATPPPNAPLRKFVRPDQQTAIPPRPVATNTATPVAIMTPAATAVMSATAMPAGTPAKPTQPKGPAGKPRPTVAPPMPNEKPTEATAAVRPTSSPSPKMTPAAALEPKRPRPAENAPSPNAADRNRRPGAGATQEERRQQRQQEQAQHRAEREQQMPERRGNKPGRSEASPAKPASTPAAVPSTATETPNAASSTPARPDKERAADQRRERREARPARRGQANLDGSPAPEASATPDAKQP